MFQGMNLTAFGLCRYGGYLGLKYMLAARLDLAAQLLPAALPFLQRGLEVRG